MGSVLASRFLGRQHHDGAAETAPTLYTGQP
jgi:hypothetical protein